MRELKFRAWDGEQFIYLDLNNIERDTLLDYFIFFARLPKQQFTGLKDHNRVEIYEGDIVKAKDIKMPSGLSREFHDCVYILEFKYSMWYLILIKNFKGAEYFYNESLHEFVIDNEIPNLEVIGNIHQNPELLTNAEGDTCT